MVNTDEAKALATRILEANEGNSLRSLSENSGIAYVTLKRNLTQTPEKLNVGQLVAIAVALSLQPGTFLNTAATVAA